MRTAELILVMLISINIKIRISAKDAILYQPSYCVMKYTTISIKSNSFIASDRSSCNF